MSSDRWPRRYSLVPEPDEIARAENAAYCRGMTRRLGRLVALRKAREQRLDAAVALEARAAALTRLRADEQEAA